MTKRFLRSLACVVFTGALALAGCNAILGNEEGTPRSALADAATPGDDGTAPDASITTDRCDEATEKSCFGICIKRNDPKIGCAAEDTCVACDPKNVNGPGCAILSEAASFSCSYDACLPGFQDCDGDKANGCETSRNDKSHCGTCGKECTDGTPLCARLADSSYDCVSDCPDGTEQCDGACVDTQTDTQNCGACGLVCRRPGAVADCVGGACKFQCSAAFGRPKACGDLCVSAEDPQYCLNCQPCPPRPNMVATCSNNQCAYTCADGYSDCDGNLASNGCETQGKCPSGVRCGNVYCNDGQICCNGQCRGLLSLCILPL